MGHRKQHTSAERQRRFMAGEFVIYDEGKPRPRHQQPALQRRKRVEPPPFAAIDHRFRGRKLSPEIVEQRRRRARVAKRQRKINRPRRKRTNLVPLLWLLLASIIIGGAGGLSIPAAHADPVDDVAFLTALDAQGIGYTSASNVIAAAYAVCDYRDIGYTNDATIAMVQRNSGLDEFNAGYFVGASEAAYCPEHLPGTTRRGQLA